MVTTKFKTELNLKDKINNHKGLQYWTYRPIELAASIICSLEIFQYSIYHRIKLRAFRNCPDY